MIPGKKLIAASLPFKQFVRFRYWKDQQGAKPLYERRYGYTDKILQGELLPRDEKFGKLPLLPKYKPKDRWTEKRALFGQNDYIDILGCDQIHPTKILYDLPFWLRGQHGNELQNLIRKRKMLECGSLPVESPTKWAQINFRIKKLYDFMNRKIKIDHQKK